MEARLSMDRVVVFKKIVDIVKELSDHVTILCTESGLEMNLLTQDLVAMASVKLESDNFFTYYRINEEAIPLHVHVEEMCKILKNAVKLKGWKNMQIKLENENSNLINFKLLNSKQGSFTMKLLDIQGQSFIDGRNPIDSNIFNYEAKVPAVWFTDVCGVVQDFSKFVRVTAYENRLTFESIDDVNFSTVCVNFRYENPFSLQNKSQRIFSCEYLKKFSQFSTLSSIVTFGFPLENQDGIPLSIYYSNPDDGLSANFLLASQLEI